MWREVIFFSNTSVFIYTHTQIKKKIIFFLIPRTRDTLTFFFTFSTLTFVFILNTCPHFTYFMFLSFLQFFLFTIHFNNYFFTHVKTINMQFECMQYDLNVLNILLKPNYATPDPNLAFV